MVRAAFLRKFEMMKEMFFSFRLLQSLISCQVVGFASVENALLVKMKSEKGTEFIAKLKVGILSILLSDGRPLHLLR